MSVNAPLFPSLSATASSVLGSKICPAFNPVAAITCSSLNRFSPVMWIEPIFAALSPVWACVTELKEITATVSTAQPRISLEKRFCTWRIVNAFFGKRNSSRWQPLRHSRAAHSGRGSCRPHLVPGFRPHEQLLRYQPICPLNRFLSGVTLFAEKVLVCGSLCCRFCFGIEFLTFRSEFHGRSTVKTV